LWFLISIATGLSGGPFKKGLLMKSKIAVDYYFEDGSRYTDVFRPLDDEPEYKCGSWYKPFDSNCPALGYIESLQQGDLAELFSKHGRIDRVSVYQC